MVYATAGTSVPSAPSTVPHQPLRTPPTNVCGIVLLVSADESKKVEGRCKAFLEEMSTVGYNLPRTHMTDATPLAATCTPAGLCAKDDHSQGTQPTCMHMLALCCQPHSACVGAAHDSTAGALPAVAVSVHVTHCLSASCVRVARAPAKQLTAEQRKQRLEEIQKGFNNTIHLGDQKVSLAVQTYETVRPQYHRVPLLPTPRGNGGGGCFPILVRHTLRHYRLRALYLAPCAYLRAWCRTCTRTYITVWPCRRTVGGHTHPAA